MASAWQQAANQKNAELSTGPRTDAGKAVSAQNALKHGAYARSIDEAKGDPVQEARREEFVKRFSNGDELADETASQAYWTHRRLTRLLQTEEARSADYLKNASIRFYLDRQAEIADADTRILDTPYVSVVKLMSTVAGCARLLIRTESLEAALTERRWSDENRRLLHALRGLGEDIPSTQLKAQSDLMISLQQSGDEDRLNEVASRLREEILALRTDIEARIPLLDGEEEYAHKLAVRASQSDTTRSGMAVLRAIGQASNEFSKLMNQLERFAKAGTKAESTTPSQTAHLTVAPVPFSEEPSLQPNAAPVPKPEPAGSSAISHVPDWGRSGVAVDSPTRHASPASVRNEPIWNFDDWSDDDGRASLVRVRVGGNPDIARAKRPPSPMERKKKRR